jgi:hypothetical protein
MPELSSVEKKIAASLGISSEDFAAQKAREMAARNRSSRFGLTSEERAVCESLGLSERSFAAAAHPDRMRSEAGLLHAHQEIDRAHGETYDENQAGAVPDRELLASALKELGAYDPDKDATYDHLLRGVTYAARLLNRVAPAYADRKPIKR